MGKGRGSKRQRGKRAWFKPFSRSMVNSGPPQTKPVLDRDGELVWYSLASRTIAAKTSEVFFRGQKPPPPNADYLAAQAGNPRALLQFKLDNDGFKQKHAYKHVWLYRYKFEHCKAVFNQDSCTLVHFKILGGIVKVRRSVVYPDITTAKRRLNDGRVCWIEPVKVYRVGSDGKLIIPPESPDNTVCTT